MMISHVRKGIAVVAALALVGLTHPLSVDAQERQLTEPEPVTVLSSGGAGTDLTVPTRRSAFDLQAFGDEGSAGFRSNGSNMMCVQNLVMFANRFEYGCNQAHYHSRPNGTFSTFFDWGFAVAAPASDMPDVIDPGVVIGGGYTSNFTTLIIGGAVSGGGDKVWASDRSGSELLAIGVEGTDDSACTNMTNLRDGNLDAGFQLMPVNDCPPTYPPGGWGGRHPVPLDNYLQLQQTDPAFGPSVDNDPFAFWRVPEDLQDTTKFMGTSATYGELNDWYLQALGRYGAVVPGGSGDPTYGGWPMGLTAFFDAFYFPLPSVGHTYFWQATIVNESERVYGVGFEYDSVYIGINFDPLLDGGQGDAHYFDSRRSAVIFQEPGGKHDPARVAPGTSTDTCGWPNPNCGSAASIMVLKSPIGDQRYKLFSDPTSDFFDPSHPRAGDTITVQHMRQCGFGDCIPETWSRSQRAQFGWWSSTGVNVLDGRAIGDLSDRAYHRIFRPEAWPQRTGEFNKYIPGVSDSNPIWDWNHDGVEDTIYVDACGSLGCVQLYGDTLPGGYANGYGNISGMAVGPVHMAPGDTVPFVVALTVGADSVTFENQLDNAIAFYNDFYLGPEAAPAPAITAVDVVPGGIRENEITLFLDDTAEEHVDPFIANLDVSADVALNPDLQAEIDALASDNVAAIHIFKSCDGGNTFTSDTDCDGDAVNDPTSKWGSFGWQPYQTFEVSDEGTFPNQFTDTNIQPGVTVTYTIVTETRGATFLLVRDQGGQLVAEEVQFAPSLLSGLSTSTTNPGVAIVYAPVNLAAGASLAQLDTVSTAGNSNVPLDVNLIGTASTGGNYRMLFVDGVEVAEAENLNNGDITTSVTGSTLVTVSDAMGGDSIVAIETFDFDRSGTVASTLAEDSVITSGNTQTTYRSGDFSLIVANVTGGSATPLMVSDILDGLETTPGEFIGRSDFPFFVVNVDEDLGGTFNQQLVLDNAGDTVAGNVVPSVRWLTTGGLTSEALDDSNFGTLTLTWEDDAFGPEWPFRINDRANVAANFQASLSARASASTSSTDAALLDVVKAADDEVTIDAADLQALELPFSVENTTFGRSVEVLVTSHQDSVLIGQSADSLRVEVPDGLWVPGDVMYFVETVTRNVLDANDNVVLDASGQPQTETVPAATFKAALGCLVPRVSCDPTIGGAQVSGYVGFQPGHAQQVQYYVPLESGDDMVVSVQPAVSARDAAAQGRVSLDGVHVVPNPYIFASEFERATDQRVLRFTNLPPEGRIRIFDVAGRFVQEINYVADDLRAGDLDWNLQTRENLVLAAGLYVFALETPDGDRTMGKFVVIR